MQRSLERLPIDWKSAVSAGLIAGLLFMMLQLILVPALGMGSAWGPPRMIAAIALGPGVLTPATFDSGIVLVAGIVHFALSIAYAAFLAFRVGHSASTSTPTITARRKKTSYGNRRSRSPHFSSP